MTQDEKSQLWEDYTRQNDILMREISKIKSEFPINVPEDKQKIIELNKQKIKVLEGKFYNLFK